VRESQLQCIREVDEAERLEQIRDRLQNVGLLGGGLVDARTDDRKTRVVVAKPQDGLERLLVGRLDKDDVRSGSRETVEERRLVTEASYDCRIQPPNVFVGFDDEEKSHEHVLVDRRMFSAGDYV
jgi:hypothetical protein